MAKTAWELIQYKEADLLSDAEAEVAAALDIPIKDAAALVSQELESYHFKRADYPSNIDQSTFMFIGMVTSSYRIERMTKRFDWIVQQLEGTGPTVLDYGGGGGKDSIIFARLGKRVTYADLINTVTPFIRRRFELRNLDIEIVDVRELGERRYDIINCMDVIEHCYDVENVTADMLSRLTPGGHLFIWPAFFNSWDGDHVEKNCGYARYYFKMFSQIGFDIVGSEDGVYHVVRRRPIALSVAKEREQIRQELYSLSAKWSLIEAMRAAAQLPVRVAVKYAFRGRFRLPLSWALAEGLSPVIDNLAIWRLSNHRLLEAEGHTL
jgi:SAM-dependent methyltransferase